MKRRILSLALATVLLMALLPVPTQAATQSGTWGDNITWSFDEATKTLTISGTGPMKDSEYNSDLGKYDSPGWCDLPVKTVIVGEGITSLSDVAFSYMDIHEISLPSTLEYIAAFAISNSPNLKELTLPASLKEIELNGWTPFSGCTGLEAIYVDTENRVYASDSQGALTDVPVGKWYTEPVLWAVEQGITNGISATEFGLNEPCNRATVVTFLWRAKGKPTPASTGSPFTDVQAGKWYSDAILWAVDNDITNGISATEFGLNNLCNRATVVTFLYRAFAE